MAHRPGTDNLSIRNPCIVLLSAGIATVRVKDLTPGVTIRDIGSTELVAVRDSIKFWTT